LNDLKPEPFKVIVKPVDSAGSDDVVLCKNMDDVCFAFNTIIGKVNHLGLANNNLLVQEFLEGIEYVVDTVSSNGDHKIVAVWEYDKRNANGAAFVYYGALLREAKDGVILSIIDYTCKVLDVLDIHHGPGHAEVKFVRDEPCLIEIGARCHGREGTDMPILDRCQGYNQVGATLDAYFDKTAFQALPKIPSHLKANGIKTTLVSYVHGTLHSMPGLAEIENMPSFVDKKIRYNEGSKMAPTIDMFTTPGCVLMVHEDAAVLTRDYERVRELEINGLYKLKEDMSSTAVYSSTPIALQINTATTTAQVPVASS
jgi:biotin carboxylase